MSIKTESIFDEHERSTQTPCTNGVHICCWLIKIGLLFLVLGLLMEYSFLGGIGVACFWLGILGLQFTGFGDSRTDIERLGENMRSDACPMCGAEGTVEPYIKCSTEIYPGILSRTIVNTKVAMVNCMNIRCTYRCSLKHHEKEVSRQEGMQALLEPYCQESAAASVDPENGLTIATNNNILSSRERASAVMDAVKEEEHRQELRQMRRDRNGIYLDINGKWHTHPDSPGLQAEFDACPECSGGVRFSRWVHKKSTNIVLGILSLAECKSETCGYISKLQRHKERIRDASQANGEHDDGNQMQSLLAASYAESV